MLEENAIYKQIENASDRFKKPVDDEALAKLRKLEVKVFLSPLDPLPGMGTNYLFCAGSKPTLEDNDGAFPLGKEVTLGGITMGDGTSHTIMIGETLRGDGGTKAEDVRRQHVILKVPVPPPAAPKKIDEQRVKAWIDDLENDAFAVREKAEGELSKAGEAVQPAIKKVLDGKPSPEVRKRCERMLKAIKKQKIDEKLRFVRELKEDAGVQEWKDGKNIAGDRGTNWMDGRFLQGTFTGTLPPNDPRPDVNCSGLGGLSSLRRLGRITVIGWCDGSAQVTDKNISLEVWKNITSASDGKGRPDDF